MLRILIAALLLLFSASLARAAAVCTADIADMNFGAVDTIGDVPAVSSADVSIECDGVTGGTETITVCASIGAGSGGTDDGIRQSQSVDDTLGFAFYTNGGATIAWGSATAPELGDAYEIDVPVEGSSASRTVQLFGVVPTGQSASRVGDYQADFSSADVHFIYSESGLDCSNPVGDGDATASFSVIASVVANCLLETSDLDFGTAGLIGDNIDAQTGLGIICTDGTDYTIAIDGGGAADPAHRLLRSGDDTVRYDLYSNLPRTAPWGTEPGSTVSGDGDGTEQQLTVYGRIPPQPAAPGAYTDTVVVTITY